MLRVNSSIAKQLGYRFVLADYFSKNVRSAKVAEDKCKIVGQIDRAAFLVNGGWQNQVFILRDLGESELLTFDRVVEENLKLRQQKMKDKETMISRL